MRSLYRKKISIVQDIDAFEMERQKEELQALQAIYMDDLQDLSEKVIYLWKYLLRWLGMKS